MKEGTAAGIPDSWRALTRPSVVLIAILALTFYLRLLFFGQYIDGDVGRAGYLAWRMAEGEVVFDPEGPGKPLLYPMLYSLFIRFFGPSVPGLKMFGAIFVLLAVLAVYWLANQAYGKKVGLLAALLFGVFSSGPIVEGGTVNLETILHLPYILAIGLFFKATTFRRLRWYFLAGLCAAMATLVKQVGGVLFFVFLGHGIHEWWKKKDALSRKQCLYHYIVLFSGALLPVIGLVGFYQFHGYTLNQLYDFMLGSNFRYIQRGYEYKKLFQLFYLSMKDIVSENGILWLATMFGVAHIGWRIWRGKEQTADRILLWWVFLSFAVLWASGTFFWHYFLQIIAPFSVAGAYGIVASWEVLKSLSPSPRFVVKAGWTALLIIMVILFIRTDYKYFFSYTPVEQTVLQHEISKGIYYQYGLYNAVQQEVANYVRAHTEPTETIYVWGIAPQIYFLAQRKTITRYWTNANMSALVTSDAFEALKAYAPMVMEDLRRSYPAYIVQIFRLEDFPELQAFVRDHYVKDGDVEFFVPPFSIHLYRKRP